VFGLRRGLGMGGLEDDWMLIDIFAHVIPPEAGSAADEEQDERECEARAISYEEHNKEMIYAGP